MLMVKEVPATSSSAARSPKDELFVTAAPNRFLLSLLPSPLLPCFQSGMFPAPGAARAGHIHTQSSSWILPKRRFHRKRGKREHTAQSFGNASLCSDTAGQRLRARPKGQPSPGAAVSSFSLFIFEPRQ